MGQHEMRVFVLLSVISVVYCASGVQNATSVADPKPTTVTSSGSSTSEKALLEAPPSARPIRQAKSEPQVNC